MLLAAVALAAPPSEGWSLDQYSLLVPAARVRVLIPSARRLLLGQARPLPVGIMLHVASQVRSRARWQHSFGFAPWGGAFCPRVRLGKVHGG